METIPCDDSCFVARRRARGREGEEKGEEKGEGRESPRRQGVKGRGPTTF